MIAQGFAEGLPAMGHASACRMAVDLQSPGYLVPLPFCVGCLATEAVCSVCVCVCVRVYKGGWVDVDRRDKQSGWTVIGLPHDKG